MISRFTLDELVFNTNELTLSCRGSSRTFHKTIPHISIHLKIFQIRAYFNKPFISKIIIFNLAKRLSCSDANIPKPRQMENEIMYLERADNRACNKALFST